MFVIPSSERDRQTTQPVTSICAEPAENAKLLPAPALLAVKSTSSYCLRRRMTPACRQAQGGPDAVKRISADRRVFRVEGNSAAAICTVQNSPAAFIANNRWRTEVHGADWAAE
jgi:hypothetical protein